jgi:hypothetical protein
MSNKQLLRSAINEIMVALKYDPDQERDEKGRFASGGGSGESNSDFSIDDDDLSIEDNFGDNKDDLLFSYASIGYQKIPDGEFKSRQDVANEEYHIKKLRMFEVNGGRKDRSGLDTMHIQMGRDAAVNTFKETFVEPKGALPKQAIVHANRWAKENRQPLLDVDETYSKGQAAEKIKKEKAFSFDVKR